MKQFRHAFSNRPSVRLENSFPPSLAQLRPLGNISDMVDRYVRTGELPMTSSHPVHFDEDFADPKDFDLSDITANELTINELTASLPKAKPKVDERSNSQASGGGIDEARGNDNDTPRIATPKAKPSEDREAVGE